MVQNHIHGTLIGPTALYDSPVPILVISAMRSLDPSLLRRHTNESMKTPDGQMARLAAAHYVDYISLLALQCSDFPCSANAANPWPEIFDQEHFNIEGSNIIARKVRQAYSSFGM